MGGGDAFDDALHGGFHQIAHRVCKGPGAARRGGGLGMAVDIAPERLQGCVARGDVGVDLHVCWVFLGDSRPGM